MSIKFFYPFWACAVLVDVFCGALPAFGAPLRVLTTFYPVYVASLNVLDGVPDVEISNLAPPLAGCLHDYRLTPGDLRKIASADLVLASGGGLEAFLPDIARQSPPARVVEVSSGIPLQEGNTHVWLSFGGHKQQVRNIAEAIAEMRPELAETLRANVRAYEERVSSAEKKMRAALEPYAGSRVITFHSAFPYLMREMGLEVAGVIEAEPGAEPSARELSEVIRLAREKKVAAIFSEPGSGGALAAVVARETGLPARELDLAVAGPADPAAARGAWLQAMEKNADALVGALREQAAH